MKLIDGFRAYKSTTPLFSAIFYNLIGGGEELRVQQYLVLDYLVSVDVDKCTVYMDRSYLLVEGL